MKVLHTIQNASLRFAPVIFALTIIACGKDNLKVDDVKLNQTQSTVMADAGFQLVPLISPDNAKDKAVTWKSSDTTIAKVSSSGYVSGISVGNAIIVVTTHDGGKQATCDVTVTPCVGFTRAQVQAAYEAQGYTTTITQDIASAGMPAYLFENGDDVVQFIFFTNETIAATLKPQFDNLAQTNGFTCKQDGRILYYGTATAEAIYEGM
ncbi:MAG: Ig-like domain-containing protein [Bacteroidales bacterium]|jgi:hypothetical protein|nr:Ig-like domain-containing protein [Bacteroidales bacterium]